MRDVTFLIVFLAIVCGAFVITRQAVRRWEKDREAEIRQCERAQDIALAERRLEVEERQFALNSSKATQAAANELRIAELRAKTAEATQRAALAEELHKDQLDAEQRKIRALAAATERIATDLAREEHAARQPRTGNSLIALFKEYKAVAKKGVDLKKFAQILDDHQNNT